MSKKWIAVTSSKGGTGKSVFARFLGEMLRTRQSNTWLFDGDGSVGQLLQYLGTRGADGVLEADQDPAKGVGSFPFLAHGSESAMRDSQVAITEALSGAPGTVLLDLPAASLDVLGAYESELELSTALKSSGWDPVLCLPITPYKASRRAVADALALGSGYKLVVVRSEWHGDDRDYGLWMESQLRTKFFAAGGVEIVMPRLRPWILAMLDDKSWGFHEALDHLGMLDRPVLNAWLQKAEMAVLGASEVFGLNGTPEAASKRVKPVVTAAPVA